MLRISVALVATIGVSLVLADSPIMAQVPDPVMAAQAPVPGAGHNYIGLATETVNPADGSLTFDLPLPLPPGRGLSFPYSIHYNSGLMYYLSAYGYSGSTFPALTWVPTPQSSYPASIPFLSFQAAIERAFYSQSGNEGQISTYHQCDWTTGFVFQGLDGVQYPLGLVGAHWSDTEDAPGDPPDTSCPYQPAVGGTVHGILVTPGTQDPTKVYGQPSMTLTDPSGTVYSFAAFPVGQVSSFVPFAQSEILYPQTITDRNGNQLTLTYINQNETGYTDTLGRLVVSWTSGQGGTTIGVSGFGNISITSTQSTSALTFPGSITSTTQTNQPCTKDSTQPFATNYTESSVIALPNGKAYTLSFDPSFGQINKIMFPGGGSISYTWGTNVNSSSGNASYTLNNQNVVTIEGCTFQFDTPAITDRDVNDGTSQVLHQHFSYTTNWSPTSPGVWTSKQTIVTTEDMVSGKSSTTTYTYGPIEADISNTSSWLGSSLPVERSIQYSDSTGVLETINKTWGDVRHVIGEQTILNGQGSAKQYCYDANEQLTDVYEYNLQSAGSKPGDPTCYSSAFQAQTGSGAEGDPGFNNSAIGPLMRHTATLIHSFAGTHIVNEPDSVTVYDGSQHQMKQSSYVYDGGTIATSNPPTQTGLASPPGLRGNATSVIQWSNTGTSATTTYTYYETGQPASKTDPCGNTSCSDMTASSYKTSYVYTDNTSGGNAAGNSNAYLTTVKDPLGHMRTFSYDYPSGKLITSTDEYVSGTGNTTTYHYNTEASQCTTSDGLDRLTEIDYPGGGVMQYCYNDSVPSITTNQLFSGSTWKTTVGTMDGLGHVIGTEVTTDPAGPDYTRTKYDGLGRVYQVWNPSRCNPLTATSCSNESTWGSTLYGYNGLGQKTSQTDSDGSSTERWMYNGNVVTFTDENQHSWQRTSDGLGRLQVVVEPNGAATYYTYDALDNLTCAAQDGGSGGAFSSCAAAPAAWRPRSFTYDSLSRLVQSFNPEAGWTCYGTSGGAVPNGSNCANGYDANGNLTFKTDARNIVTSYSYDALNRLLSKRFSNDPGSTPSSCYQYDSASLGVGRLGVAWTQSGSAGACAATAPSTGLWSRRSILSYDAMGRILGEQQCTPSNCTSNTPYAPAYTFDLAGNLYTATNGVTSTPTVGTLSFTSPFDGAGRLLSVSSNWNDATHPSSLFSAQSGSAQPCPGSLPAPYAAFGGLMNATYGGNLILNRGYDARLRTGCETDTGSLLINSTSASATVTVTGTEQSQ